MADVGTVPGALPLNLRDGRTKATTVVSDDAQLLALMDYDAPLYLCGARGEAPPIPHWLSRSAELRCVRALSPQDASPGRWMRPGLVVFTADLADQLARLRPAGGWWWSRWKTQLVRPLRRPCPKPWPTVGCRRH